MGQELHVKAIQRNVRFNEINFLYPSQKIFFYKEMNLIDAQIKAALKHPETQNKYALYGHKNDLAEKKSHPKFRRADF